MKLIFFAHPAFMGYQSMRRFVSILADGMNARGHQVGIWAPKARFSRLTLSQSKRKWLGYVDKYVLFPSEVRSRLEDCSPDTLFVIIDNALGLWVPLVADRPHVIHYTKPFYRPLEPLKAAGETDPVAAEQRRPAITEMPH